MARSKQHKRRGWKVRTDKMFKHKVHEREYVPRMTFCIPSNYRFYQKERKKR